MELALAQVERVAGYRPAVAIADRGKTHWRETVLLTLCVPKKSGTAYAKRKARARFRRWAAIEPRIGHLKSDFRLGRNRWRGRHDEPPAGRHRLQSESVDARTFCGSDPHPSKNGYPYLRPFPSTSSLAFLGID